MKKTLTALSLASLVLGLSPVLAFAANIGTSNTATSTTSGLNSGLVGYWTLDGKDVNWATGVVTGRSGAGETGSLISMSTTTTPAVGKIGQAFNFDGADDYVNLQNFGVTGASARTVSLWIKSRNVTTPAQVAFAYGTNLSLQDFAIRVPNTVAGEVYVRVSGRDWFTSGGAVGANQWTHIVVSYDGGAIETVGSIKVFVNGVRMSLTDTGATTGTLNTGTTYFVIGKESIAGTKFFNGSIDDVRVYNRVLSTSEIKQIYAQGGGATVGQAITATSTAAGLASGLVGYWTLDGKDVNWATGNVTDRSGSGNSGSLTGMSTTTTPVSGKIGQALKFDGVNDFVNLGTGTLGISAGSTAITLSSWVYVRNFQSYPAMIGKSVAGSPFGGWQINANGDSGNKFGGGMNISNTWTAVTSDATYSTNRWYLVTMTYDGGALRLYVNGVLAKTTVAAGTIQYKDVNSSVYIGRNPASDTPVQYLSGSLDDVRVYNRTLTPAEIRLLYKQGAAAVGQSNTTSGTTSGLNSGLLGHWTFDGKNVNWATGSTTDASGNGNYGSLTGMSTTTTPVGGKVGQALRFNGSSSYVPLLPSLGVTAQGTWSAWFKTTSSGNNEIIGKDILSGTNYNHRVAVISGQVQFLDNIAGVNSYTLTSAGTYNDGKWHFMTATWGAGAKLYVDGVLVGSSVSNAADNTGTYISIGRNNNENAGATWYFNGSIDEVRTYNRILSASEVRQLYFSGR
ncbi:MAG: LamG domain-containing protein [Patescibacteria group bacterium]